MALPATTNNNNKPKRGGYLRLGDLLISAGLITEEQLQEGLRLQKGTGKRLGTVLQENGFITENGAIYYYVNGVMQKNGLILVDGDYYYVRTSTGEVVTGRTYWITYTNGLLDEGNYNFDAQGKIVF